MNTQSPPIQDHKTEINKENIPELKEQLPKRDIGSFVVFGITGSGKSTFANTIVGNKAFEESMRLYSKTDFTVGKTGVFDGQPVCVIDTPGLEDCRGTDAEHLIQMTQYIKEMTSVKAFVFVINFNNFRFDRSVIRLFQLMSQMYPEKKWYHHIAIVWTNYYSSLPENIKQSKDIKKKESLEIIKKEVLPNASEEELDKIPQYFIDSVEARNKDSESRAKLNFLLAWIAQLRPLSETLGEIQKVDKDVQKEEIQTERRTVSDVIELNIRTIETALFERSKKTLYNGQILYTDWVEKEGTRQKDKKVLIPPPPNVQTEERESEKVLGERRQVDERINGIERGRIMQRKQKKKERRIRKIFTGGKEEYGPWEVIHDEEMEVEVGRFGDNIPIDNGSGRTRDKSDKYAFIASIPKIVGDTFSVLKSLF